jgi:hypothetical protein
MKRYFLILFLCSFAVCFTPQKISAQNVSVNFQFFYNELSPYGVWVDNADYGYVWVPNVGRDFSPYASNGYWIFTTEGWTWVSNYSWGWAPFHYGRWYYDAIYGSIWVPDNIWGPGWVNWRRSEGYYGWSPMRPNFGIGHNDRNGGWRFVRDRDFGRKDIHNYYVNRNDNTRILKGSNVITNIHTDQVHNVSYNSGPDRKEIEKHQGKTIALVDIKENTVPGQHLNNNQLDIYKPVIEKDNTNKFKPVPINLTDIKDVKRRDEQTPRNPNLQPTNMQPANQLEPIKQPTRQVKPEIKAPQQPQRIDKPIRQPNQPLQPVRQQSLPPKNEPVKQPPHIEEKPKTNIPASPEQYKQPVPNRLPRREVPEPQPKGEGEQIHH